MMLSQPLCLHQRLLYISGFVHTAQWLYVVPNPASTFGLQYMLPICHQQEPR